MFSYHLNYPYSHMGALGQFRLDKILTLFQDLASEHCKILGITGFDLASKELMWVVSSACVAIKRHPEFAEPLTLETDRSSLKNLYELRSFAIRDGNGLKIICAQGMWVMVKQSNFKPVRLSTFLPDSLLAINDEQAGEALLDDIQDFKYPDFIRHFRIRSQDLDMNRHVNNTVYVQWAMDSLPDDMILNYIPQNAHIRFHKQSFFTERIASKTKIEIQKEHLTTWHAIENQENGQTHARLKMVWSKLKPNGIL
ncbi:MAG: hypothetical protein GY729_15285 [Desulfobacteraceae bacterium]|nr:hypothetical protein [Desulfobacteraceae bacterium]